MSGQCRHPRQAAAEPCERRGLFAAPRWGPLIAKYAISPVAKYAIKVCSRARPVATLGEQQRFTGLLVGPDDAVRRNRRGPSRRAPAARTAQDQRIVDEHPDALGGGSSRPGSAADRDQHHHMAIASGDEHVTSPSDRGSAAEHRCRASTITAGAGSPIVAVPAVEPEGQSRSHTIQA
jgi:hypothetical protein